jgi:hypothetical protein
LIEFKVNANQIIEIALKHYVFMKKLLLLLVLSSCLTLFSAEQTESRFGFSGGGAKGFAHIGVLKVLEEAGLKIDYIEEQVWGLLLVGMHQDIPQLKLILFFNRQILMN